MDTPLELLAPCGLNCSKCEAYIATQANDSEMLEQVAAKWRKLNNCDDICAQILPCDGCMHEGGRKFFFCQNLCEIRKCAISKGFHLCTDCPENPCQKLSEFLSHFQDASKNEK